MDDGGLSKRLSWPTLRTTEEMDTIGPREVTALDMTLDKFTRTSGTRFASGPLDVSREPTGRRADAPRSSLRNIYDPRKTEDRPFLSLPLSLCVCFSFCSAERLMRRPLVSTRCRRQERFGPRKFQSRVLHHTLSDPMELIDDQIDLTSIPYTRPS